MWECDEKGSVPLFSFVVNPESAKMIITPILLIIHVGLHII